MIIGVPREIKADERRVGLTPAGTRELVREGHQVLIESEAGFGIRVSDDAYRTAGANISPTADEIFGAADLVIKVKEPQAAERARLRPGQILFTYLHLAPDLEQTKDLLASGAHCLAYETVTSPSGGLPLLTPMSQVAGRLSIQAGARCLEAVHGGCGRLIGGVPGVEAARVAILGGGVVGENAIQMALGMGGNVRVLDRDLRVLDRLASRFGPALQTIFSTSDAIDHVVRHADLVIGAVLLKGAAAPRLVSATQVREMAPGSVLVDVAIDQGGCFETSRPTTHGEPTYVVDDVVHYCVANMPGAVPTTATEALTHATLPFILSLARQGLGPALRNDPHFRAGLNVSGGLITEPAVAREQGHEFVEPAVALEAL